MSAFVFWAKTGLFNGVIALGCVTFLLEMSRSAGARTGFWILSHCSLW